MAPTTFSVDYDGRSNDYPGLAVNYQGVRLSIYFYSDYDGFDQVDLTKDEGQYHYQSPSADDCSICWDNNSCSFTVSYHEDGTGRRHDVYGGGLDVIIPLTPQTHAELIGVLREIKQWCLWSH